MEAEQVMPTPQITSSAPVRDCPKCGRRMQVLAATDTCWTYVCYAHSYQNAGTNDPFYINVHHKFLDEDGRILVKKDDPRLIR